MSQPNDPRNPNWTKLATPLASNTGQRQQQNKKQAPQQKNANPSKNKRLGGTQNRNAPHGKK